jgi:hypothetical protein
MITKGRITKKRERHSDGAKKYQSREYRKRQEGGRNKTKQLWHSEKGGSTFLLAARIGASSSGHKSL